MSVKKQLALITVGTLLLAVTFPSHARGVYGNVGYHEYPWSILVGYSDYGRSYDRGHRHGHGHKHGHYHHHKKHHKHYHKKHYRHHHDYGRKHYRKYRDHYYSHRDRYRRGNRCDY